MKVALAVHGYPPELSGGTEQCVQALARALVRSGHEVVVFAGTLARAPSSGEPRVELDESLDFDRDTGRRFRVVRARRSDLYCDHWQKSGFPPVSKAFASLVRSEQCDVAHVHHWIRLSRDLVHAAAQAGVPAVASLHDAWASCPITFRVRPAELQPCSAPVGPDPCIACAGSLAPRTPWIGRADAEVALAGRQRAVLRELALARAVLVPTMSHARSLEAFLGLERGALAARAVPPFRGFALARQPPLSPPTKTEKLVLGSWGELLPHKGPDLVLAVVRGLRDPSRVELHFAGRAGTARREGELRSLAQGLNVVFHGVYHGSGLASHAVARVHAMVSGTRALESYGVVVDEALDLGLACVLPAQPAFVERAQSGGWALLYEPGNKASLSKALQRLLDEPALLCELASNVPPVRDAQRAEDERLETLLAIYREAIRRGPPSIPQEDPSEHAAALRSIAAWDESLSRTSAVDLGLAPAEPQ